MSVKSRKALRAHLKTVFLKRWSRTLALVNILLIVGFVSAPCTAETAGAGFEGNWFVARGVKPMPELQAKLAPGVAFVRDTGSPRLNGGDFGDLKVTPQAREAAMAWDPLKSQTVSDVCRPPSIIYAMPGPFPIEIYSADKLMVFKLEYYDLVRIVFMDGRPHPGDDYPHTAVGHSVGRWEGDILVVDTTHLHAATIVDNGLNHSDNVHVIERFRLSADGKYLHMTQEFDDPQVILNRAARYVVYERTPGYVHPYNCDPAYGQSIQTRELE